MKPSRTFTIAVLALCIEALLAAVLVGVAWLAPAALGTAAPTLGTIALSVAALGGAGSGAMAWRDGKSGGLTSSQGAAVLAASLPEPP
jgi:hypothetical protein